MPRAIIDENKCKGCALCTTACPKKIVVISDHINIKGFKPATISDESLCTGCTFCAIICPDCAIEVER